MFTWEEAGLLRIMLLALKWAAILLVASGSLIAAAALAGCPARSRSPLSIPFTLPPHSRASH